MSKELFTESHGKALRTIKPGEILTAGQWEAVCSFVREQDAIIDAYKDAARESAPEAPSPQAQGGEAFADWLAREMPPGTVIGNPRWWAPRILRAIERAPQRAPGVDDDTLDKMRDVLCRRYYEVSGRSLDRAYTRAALEAALAAPVSAGDGGEGRWLPSAAEWLDSTNAEASQDWRDGWDACRNRHATLRLTSGASGVDWRGQYRLQTAMRYMDNRPELTIERAYAMADEDIRRLLAAAPAHQGQGERGEGE